MLEERWGGGDRESDVISKGRVVEAKETEKQRLCCRLLLGVIKEEEEASVAGAKGGRGKVVRVRSGGNGAGKCPGHLGCRRPL